MTSCGLWLTRRHLVAVMVGSTGDSPRVVRAALTHDARYGLVEYLGAVDVQVVVTEALARTDPLPADAARRGVPVWTAPDDLVAAVIAAGAIRDPSRAAALLARLPRVSLLRASLRRLALPGSDAHQLSLV